MEHVFMEDLMKNLVKFCTIFMTMVTMHVQADPLFLQINSENTLKNLSILSNFTYPTNAKFSNKKIPYLSTNDKDLFLFIRYSPDIYQKISVDEIKATANNNKNNSFNAKLLKQEHGRGPIAYDRVFMFIVPEKIVVDTVKQVEALEQEINKIDPTRISLKGFDPKNSNAVNQYHQLADKVHPMIQRQITLLQELNAKTQYVMSLSFDALQNENHFDLPAYKTPAPTTMSAPHTVSTTRMMKQSNERILKLRIPEQEIQVGVTLD